MQDGARWILPKKGKVAFVKGTTEVDATKAGGNPSALSLSYRAKDGTFKGSFKVYSANGGRLKSSTVPVAGVLVDGAGYGTAAVKRLGSAPARIGGGESNVR